MLYNAINFKLKKEKIEKTYEKTYFYSNVCVI